MSKWVHGATRASPGDRPGPQIHSTPLDPARFSAPGTLHRPPEACRDGPRAMPGPKIGSKSVSNCVANQIRGFNSGRKTRSHTPHFASLISRTTPLISSEMKPEGCGLTDEKWRRAIRNARCEMRDARRQLDVRTRMSIRGASEILFRGRRQWPQAIQCITLSIRGPGRGVSISRAWPMFPAWWDPDVLSS